MPIFDFTCKHCGHEFESISKPFDKVACPNCKAEEHHPKKVSLCTYTINPFSNPASTSPKKVRSGMDKALKSGPLGSDNEGLS